MVEDYNHPDPCWSLRRQYMITRSSDSWWRFQNCLAQHNYNNLRGSMLGVGPVITPARSLHQMLHDMQPVSSSP